MEKIITVLCILVLGVTAVDGVVEIADIEVPGFTDEGGEDNGDNGDVSTVQSVTVPEQKLRDIVLYDWGMRVEMRFENKSSGEWNQWILDVEGQQLLKIPGTKTVPDGFGGGHSALYLRRHLDADFTLIVDSSDGEEVTTHGKIDIQRDEYTDLNEEKMIFSEAWANITVEPLQSTTRDLTFEGFMRSFFDPEAPIVETLDDSIYGEGQTIELGDDGFYRDNSLGGDLKYLWKAEKGEIVSGYDCIFINVSTDFGSENFSIPFREKIWISNDVSLAVGQFIRTNASWESENSSGFLILENKFILADDVDVNGFTPGTQEIPWGECDGVHWETVHPDAVLESWSGNHMPKSGDIQDTSFDFKTDDVINWLKVDEPSEGFTSFLVDYPDAIVMSASYNASKESLVYAPDDPEGVYYWNLTFGHKRDSDEDGSSWNYPYRYQVLVSQTIRRVSLVPLEYETKLKLEKDFGVLNGTSPLSADDISYQTVTWASSEQIFKSDDVALESFYTGPGGGSRDELDWGDGTTKYQLGTSDWEQAGMALIETLTNIEFVSFPQYTWNLEMDDLMESGKYASATLDAETGRLVNIAWLEGDPLSGALNFGD